MARFDVYASPIVAERKQTPFWLDVQADHLQTLETRVILPLRRVLPKQHLKSRLNPQFTVEGVLVYVDTPNIGTFPLGLLQRPVSSLRSERLVIEDALDFLFLGF
jgi:toxin CcdB